MISIAARLRVPTHEVETEAMNLRIEESGGKELGDAKIVGTFRRHDDL